MDNLSTNPSAPPTSPARRRLSARRRLLFVVLTVATLFAAQEALFRFLFPLPEVLFNRATYMPQWYPPEMSVKRAKALCNIVVRWECEPDGMSFDHTLNLYGFRGPDFPIEPPADRPRIVFLGDSFVEGCGTSDDDTLPRQFARLVGEQSAEVLNLGITGANFPEYLRLMLDAVPLLRPHTVFLVVCFNDLPTAPFDTPVPPAGGLAALEQRRFLSVDPYVPRIAQAISLLNESWVLPRRWHPGPFPFFEPVPAPSNPLSSGKRVEGLDPEVERAMRAGKANPSLPGTFPVIEQILRGDYEQDGGVANLLRFMAWFCSEYGAGLNVIYIPNHVTANRAYLPAQVKLGGCARMKMPASFSDEAHRAQQRHLTRACRDARIPFVDTTDAFIAGERAQRLFWPTDSHCNAAGYRLVAEVCTRCWNEGR
jgi:lysophospholipase L1-like esterase